MTPQLKRYKKSFQTEKRNENKAIKDRTRTFLSIKNKIISKSLVVVQYQFSSNLVVVILLVIVMVILNMTVMVIEIKHYQFKNILIKLHQT